MKSKLCRFAATAGALMLASCAASATTPFRFGAPVQFAAGKQPRQVVAGDLNGDGKLDLVCVETWGSRVLVLIGNGDGTFLPAKSFAAPAGYLLQGVTTGDFDGDGKIDVVAVSGAAGGTVPAALFFRGMGDGTLSTTPIITSVNASPMNVRTGDLNKDGKLDLFIGGNGGAGILLGNGDGTFTNFSYPSQVNGGVQTSMAIADLNNDGHMDVFSANSTQSSSGVAVWLQDTTGALAQPTEISLNVNQLYASYWVDSTDLNLDGVPDIVDAQYSYNGIAVLLGNGDGTLQQLCAGKLLSGRCQSAGYGGTSPNGLAIADFNGDGRPDVAASDFNDPSAGTTDGFGVTINAGVGDGFFDNYVRQQIDPGAQATSIITADFNGDGLPDIAITNWSAGTIDVMLNQTPPTNWTIMPRKAQWRYAPHVTSGGGFITKLTIANLATATNNITVNYVNQDGTLGSSTPYTLAAGATLRLSTPESERWGAVKTQWAVVGADKNIVVNAFLELKDPSGRVINTIGFNDDTARTMFSIPVEFQLGANGIPRTVGLAMSNPNSIAANVTLNLNDSNGNNVASATVPISGYGQFAIDLSTIPAFQAAVGKSDFIGQVQIASQTVPITALSLGDDHGPFYATPPMTFGPSGVHIVPHMITGGGFVTKLSIVNLTSVSDNVTVNFLDQSGNTLQSQPLTLAPYATTQISTAETARYGPAQISWATVTSSTSTDVNAFWEMEDASGNVVNTIGFNYAIPVTDFTVPAEFEGKYGDLYTRTVGLAMANANTSAANVTLKLVDSTGAVLATYSLALNPNQQTAIDLLSIPAFAAALPQGNFVGTIAVSSTQPLSAIALGDDLGPFYSTPVVTGRAR